MASARLLSVTVPVAVVLLLSSCAGAPDADSGAADEAASSADYPVRVASCGVTSTLDGPPKRAVTMNQGATEVALALGVENQLAGTAYLDDSVPKRWRDAYESVPVLAEEYPDHETVLEARPDLVYASYVSAFDDEAAGDRGTLHEYGAGTYVSPYGCGDGAAPKEVTFDVVWREIREVAEVFGVPERARKIRERQRERLAQLRKERAGEGLEAFWFDSGTKTAFAGAGEGGPQLVLDAVGATNVFADVEGGWADVSWEDVVAADPDVIVLADAEWSTAEDKIERLKSDEALSKLRAVREERFVTVAYSESTPGVRLVDGARSVAEQLGALDLPR
ncbi:ABC transporter substrate-binding protein [Streptomyces oceani]|uniref:Iron ABC transporter substrate-binding protein n=1 Tax=Streptomyces oceani TaxID=1075402 RepID=A0A1E7JX61_9ACTN|nr:ABC transporter substrate-binding protein [Streptomyces oceani]OEU96228.1 iron ABC transporter substrate-binding protein [Streptomyces oceani]